MKEINEYKDLLQEALLEPTKDLIAKLEALKDSLNYEQRRQLAQLKFNVEYYEERKAKEKRKHDL